MKVAGLYSFNQGREILEAQHTQALAEVYQAISQVDATLHKTKKSREKRMMDRILYNPKSINEAFTTGFTALGWSHRRVPTTYTAQFYTESYAPPPRRKRSRSQYREMDFVKGRVGIEVQFGKYAFMVYNVAAKMTIFHNLDIIDVGVEIVPVKELVEEMSSGVSYFEQFVWDLEHRGVSNIDIPVLVLGVL